MEEARGKIIVEAGGCLVIERTFEREIHTHYNDSEYRQPVFA